MKIVWEGFRGWVHDWSMLCNTDTPDPIKYIDTRQSLKVHKHTVIIIKLSVLSGQPYLLTIMTGPRYSGSLYAIIYTIVITNYA